MKTRDAKVEFTRLAKAYAGLCRMLMPRPIHDKVDFENVTEITDAMAGHKLAADGSMTVSRFIRATLRSAVRGFTDKNFVTVV
jgi:hypothetical protein